MTQGAFETYITVVTKKYSHFGGRADLREFWLFTVTSFCISIGCSMLDVLLNTRLVGSIYGLAVLIPTVAVAVRRLHDLNKTGWWWLLPIGPALVGYLLLRSATNTLNSLWYFGSHSSPMVTLVVKLTLGWLVSYVVMICWLVQPGTSGPNKYGE